MTVPGAPRQSEPPGEAGSGQRPLCLIQFVGGPRSVSHMEYPPPERLRVAEHRQAHGVYRILGDDEAPQAFLWVVREWRREREGAAPRGGMSAVAVFYVEDDDGGR